MAKKQTQSVEQLLEKRRYTKDSDLWAEASLWETKEPGLFAVYVERARGTYKSQTDNLTPKLVSLEEAYRTLEEAHLSLLKEKYVREFASPQEKLVVPGINFFSGDEEMKDCIDSPDWVVMAWVGGPLVHVHTGNEVHPPSILRVEDSTTIPCTTELKELLQELPPDTLIEGVFVEQKLAVHDLADYLGNDIRSRPYPKRQQYLKTILGDAVLAKMRREVEHGETLEVNLDSLGGRVLLNFCSTPAQKQEWMEAFTQKNFPGVLFANIVDGKSFGAMDWKLLPLLRMAYARVGEVNPKTRSVSLLVLNDVNASESEDANYEIGFVIVPEGTKLPSPGAVVTVQFHRYDSQTFLAYGEEDPDADSSDCCLSAFME
jgi:hypothetical protein